MKKLITVLLAFVASLSLILFAACESETGGETPVVITASLSKTQANVGEEVTVTYSATGDATVTVTYAKDGGDATPFTGNAFTASEAGTYVFTFTAEGAETVTRTLTVSQPSQPAATVSVALKVNGLAVAATNGQTVNMTRNDYFSLEFSAPNDAAVTVVFSTEQLGDETLEGSDLEIFQHCEATALGVDACTLTFKAEDCADFVLHFQVTDGTAGEKIEVTFGDAPVTEALSAEIGDTLEVGYELPGGKELSALLLSVSDPLTGTSILPAVNRLPYLENFDLNKGTLPLPFESGMETGTYKIVFKAEGCADFVLLIYVTESTPEPAPAISVTIDGSAVTSGSSVTKKVDERISAKVSVTNVAAGGYKILRYFNDIYLDDVTDSISEFKNYTFRESDIGTIRFECYIGEETQPIFVFSVTVEATAKITALLSEDSIEAYETVNITCSAATVADQTPVSVEIRYKEANDNVWREISGTAFTPTEAGAYSIRFKAKGAKTVTHSLTVTEHVTHQYAAVEVDYNAGTMTSEWTHSVNCSLCNAAKELTVPAVSATGSDWEHVSVEKQPSCIEGEGTYRITVEGVVITVKKVPIPAAGEHSYDNIEIDYADLTDGNITAYSAALNCTGNCGTALAVSSLPAFTDEKWSSQVTNAPSCSASGAATYTMEYTANDGSGKQASVIITVKGVPVPATGAHDWSDYEMTSEHKYERHCQNAGCDASESHAVTGLTIAQAPEYLVMESNGDVSLDGFTVVAGFNDPELSYTLTEENKADAAQFSNKTLYGETTVTFNFGVRATSETLVIYEIAVAAGTVTADSFLPDILQMATVCGEAELHFTLSNVVENTEQTEDNVTPTWRSWTLKMVAGNGKANTLRVDDWCLGLWGFGDGNAASSNGIYTNVGEKIASGTIDFVITRTFVTDHYEIVVDITDGTNTRKVTFKEPASNGNTMTFWLGGDTLGGTGSYNYSDVLYRETGLNTLTVDSISADNITVPLGTSLETVKSLLTVTASYKEGGLDEPVPFNLSGSYNSETADTYTLTVTYGSDESISCPVQVTVLEQSAQLLKEYSLTETDADLTLNGVTLGADGAVFTAGATHRSIVISESVYEGKIADGIVINFWATPQSINEDWEALFSIYDDGASASDASKYQHFRIGITGLDFGFNTNGGSFSGGGFNNIEGSGGLVDTENKETMYTICIAADSIKLYVNATLQRTYEVGAATWGDDTALYNPAEVLEMLNTYSNGIRLGGYWTDDTATSFAGTMKNVSLYAGTMTDGEIEALYTA